MYFDRCLTMEHSSLECCLLFSAERCIFFISYARLVSDSTIADDRRLSTTITDSRKMSTTDGDCQN